MNTSPKPSGVNVAVLADGDLAQAISSGDHRAFDVLVRRHDRLLQRTARRILKNDPDAEDAVQNAYLLAYRGIRNFRRGSKLSTWLVRIVINEALACLRKRSRSARVVYMGDRELDTMIDSRAEVTTQNAQMPEQLLMGADTRRLIQAGIDRLSVSYRAVFMLRGCEELSVREVAAALDIPEATVRSRFFRAREQLRESLAPRKTTLPARPAVALARVSSVSLCEP
jgi:RNA polymerase sigma-70 factor (ECF subfamily)